MLKRLYYQEDYDKRYQERKYYREKGRKYFKKAYQKLKLEVLSHYSEGTPKCTNCGEKEIKFLSIDHSFGDGTKHRKEIGVGVGSQFYYWLIKHNYPQNLGLRVLCLNCNCFFSPNRTKQFDARTHLPECQCCKEGKIEVLGFSKKLNKVLCRNCEHALRWYGYCPHQKNK